MPLTLTWADVACRAGSLGELTILRALKMLERKFRHQRVSRRLKREVGAYDAASAMLAIRQAELSIAGFAVK
jgi:hypothetical protein